MGRWGFGGYRVRDVAVDRRSISHFQPSKLVNLRLETISMLPASNRGTSGEGKESQGSRWRLVAELAEAGTLLDEADKGGGAADETSAYG